MSAAWLMSVMIRISASSVGVSSYLVRRRGTGRARGRGRGRGRGRARVRIELGRVVVPYEGDDALQLVRALGAAAALGLDLGYG